MGILLVIVLLVVAAIFGFYALGKRNPGAGDNVQGDEEERG